MDIGSKIKIKVNSEHIFRGIRNSRECCPIALSLKDELKVKEARVNYRFLEAVGEGAQGFLFFTPDEIKDFIWRFDAGLEVVPVEFEIELAHIYKEREYRNETN